jgi:hypothetical protein
MLIVTLAFERNANFFAENCQKSQKIVIITSTPEVRFDEISYGRNLRTGREDEFYEKVAQNVDQSIFCQN